MKRNLLIILLLLFSIDTFCQLVVPSFFGSNMVLQRDKKIKIWGKAKKQSPVSIEFLGKGYTTKAKLDSTWQFLFDPMPAGGNFQMKIYTQNEQIVFDNITFGDVWICSGQSNMEYRISNFPYANDEAKNANNTSIRYLYVNHVMSSSPQFNLKCSTWKLAIGDSVKQFSAVAYFFAKYVYEQTGVPIGLINTSWGGTNVETWTSKEGFAKFPEFKTVFDQLDKMKSIYQWKNEKDSAFARYVRNFVKNDPDFTNKAFTNPETENWKTVELPGKLSETDNFVGATWFATSFELSEIVASTKYEIKFGEVNGFDNVWINGNFVGGATRLNRSRNYGIKQDYLKKGKNQIVIRVLSNQKEISLAGADNNEIVLESQNCKVARQLLNGTWKYKRGIKVDANTFKEKPTSNDMEPNEFPSLLYNAMINPLVGMSFKGVIWYQGEANADRGYEYRTLFPNMITDWRRIFNQGDFPFLYVQLANFTLPKEIPSESTWAELREAQNHALKLNNVGCAVAIDIGEALDIHPKNKQDVGKRLGLAAMKHAYNKEVVFSGPTYKSSTIQDNKIIIEFDNIGSGLVVKDKYGYLKSFAIAGADKKFVWAQAKIEGSKVIVFSDLITEPKAVRYGWANNPDDVNLYNVEGLPASPFRTDDWDGITKENKYILKKFYFSFDK